MQHSTPEVIVETKLLLLFHALKRLNIASVAQQALTTHNSDLSPQEKFKTITQMVEKSLLQWDKMATRQLDEHWIKTRVPFQSIQEEVVGRAFKWHQQQTSSDMTKSQARVLLQTLDTISIDPLHISHHQSILDIKQNLYDYALLLNVTPQKDDLDFFDLLTQKTQNRFSLSSRINLFAKLIHGDPSLPDNYFESLSPSERTTLVTTGNPQDPSCVKWALLYAQEEGLLPKNAILLGDNPTRPPLSSTMDELSQKVNKEVNVYTEELEFVAPIPSHPSLMKRFLNRVRASSQEKATPTSLLPKSKA